jgi:hypothetical protein
MELTSISGHSFVGTVKTNFSYNLKRPLKVIASHKDGEYFAKVGNEHYTIIGSGTCKETALSDLCLEFHLIVVELKEFDKSISGFKNAFDFLSKYINI